MMQLYINCADCGERIGGFQLKGREQTVQVNACFHRDNVFQERIEEAIVRIDDEFATEVLTELLERYKK